MTRILVIDDEIEICDFMKSFFSSKGYEVFSATRGDEALRLFNEKEPHMVLMDIKMPGMSGLEILRQIRQKNKKVKVIMITALDDEQSIQMAKTYGADDYITKPFSLEYLESNVNQKLSTMLP